LSVQNLNWSDETNPDSVILDRFSLEHGPKHSLPIDSQPLDYFDLLVRPEFWEKLCAEKNKYAAFQIHQKPDVKWKM
jgi:hypothetical protein